MKYHSNYYNLKDPPFLGMKTIDSEFRIPFIREVHHPKFYKNNKNRHFFTIEISNFDLLELLEHHIRNL